jgi:hypothetical protein
MTIEEQLQRDLKEAMKARDSFRLEVIRGARAALQKARQELVKQRYDATRRELEAQGFSDRAADANAEGVTPLARALNERHQDAIVLDAEAQQAVIAKEVKQRRDSAAIYQQSGQPERQQQEEAEATILEGYLPRQLGADELRPAVAALIDEMGLSGPADMGKLMPTLMERYKGQADGRTLSQLARELLAQRT